jgi:hypothetical protein
MDYTKAFAFGLFFSCIANAQAGPSAGTGCMPNDLQIPSYSFIGAAFLIVATMIALAYMYSKAREDPVLGVWSKDEAFNLVISIFMFIGILGFVSGACALSYSYFEADPLAASVSYIDKITYNNGLNVLSKLTKASIDNQETATAYLYIGVSPFYGEGVGRNAAYRAWSAQKELAIDIFLPLLASLNAQKYILQAIGWVSISILLPFAFVMRLIPFTREFGNMLLALFFALYIIVPTAYALSAKAFTKISREPTAHIATGVFDFNTYGLDGPILKDKSTTLYKMGIMIPQAVFLPNLVLVMAITSLMAISKALKAFVV